MNRPFKRGSGSRRVPEPHYLAVARVERPWGIRGECKCEVLTSFPDKLGRLVRVYLGPHAAPYDVAHFRWHAGALLVKLAGVDDRNAAEALRGQLVQIAREDAVEIEPGQYYEHQILGLDVVTEGGQPLGQVVEVLSTGANDVYVVQGPRGEILLPARAEVVRQIDLAANRMTVALLPGLLPGED